MSKTNYLYIATLNLWQPGFENHALVASFDTVSAMIESIGFTTYKECAEACNQLCSMYVKQLNELNGDKFVMAWESNPKDGKETHITPEQFWQSGEIVRLYVVNKDNDLKLHTALDPLVQASVFVDKHYRGQVHN